MSYGPPHIPQFPPGWAPPYQGAAPPMPANMIVNPQQWRMGSWQFNPAFNMQRYPAPQMHWMAARAWGPPAQHRPQQPPAGFNPYKKVIKPPSAEYLAMQVSHNGLDLHNMVPKENPYGDEEDPNVPHTPWIWNPATLSNDAPSVSAHRAAIAAAAAANERAQIRQSSEPATSESASSSVARPRHATDPSSSSSASSQINLSTDSTQGNTSPLKPTFSSKIIRTPDHYRQTSNSSSTSVDLITGRMEHLSTSEPTSLSRQSSMPSLYSNSSHQSTSISGVPLTDEPMSVLSPLIIPMTPRNPIRRPVVRGATYPEIGSQSNLSTISEGPAAHDTTPRQSSSRARNSSPPPIPSQVPQTAPASQASFRRPSNSRSHSYPHSTSSLQASFPLPDSAQDRPVLQQHTPPDLDSYLLVRPPASPPRVVTPRRPIEIYAPSPPPPPQRSQSLSYVTTRHSTSRDSSRDSSPSRSFHTNSTPRHSPPEMDLTRSPKHTPPSRVHEYPITPVSLHRNPGPTSPQTYQELRPEPVRPRRIYTPVGYSDPKGRRQGYWNRRGDHCTKDGYLVFAPPEYANPSELADYPERDYQDDFGFRVAFDPKRPELPESLPRHGQPPEKPYKHFLLYN